MYLSDSCNLACSYCYVAVNQSPGARLTLEQVKKAVDEFCEKVPSPDRKVTFLGGEPLLDWKLFAGAARYARERGGPDIVLQTFTNGTLLTPEKVRFLEDTGVHCTISLDGQKKDNDLHRVYHKTKERSVYDDAMERLAPLPKANLGVSLVFTQATVDRLLSNVHAFHGMGFGRITFNPELYEDWTDDGLNHMRKALSGLALWYRKLLDMGIRPPQIQILFAVIQNLESNRLGERWWHECHNMVLGPDGRYYSCDKGLSYPIGTAKALQTGGVEGALDWTGRGRQLAAYAEYIEKLGGGDKEVFCPIGVVAHAEQGARTPNARWPPSAARPTRSPTA
ncbi:MAG: radical SAM protein [Elusimicrobiota bacterium]|nr:MAG: radical SAM protein [Elusimicrobiota bacterium]